MTAQTLGIVKVTLRSRLNGYQAKLDYLIVHKITQGLLVTRFGLKELQIPDGIRLADPGFNEPSDIDLLIGAEIYLELLCVGKIRLFIDEPF